nr:RNA-directed DNA polymerase, eukaryota [Tanacetum cinerariifolium]
MFNAISYKTTSYKNVMRLKETSSLGEIVSLEKSNKNVIGLKNVNILPVNLHLVIVIRLMGVCVQYPLRGVPSLSGSPALVLDDSCVLTRDLANHVMGEVKHFSSINSLHFLVAKEGFSNVKIAYLGRLWVMIELPSSIAKGKFLNHIGVASWFKCLDNAQADFVSRERIVWVDIEGIPVHAWARNTFLKIGSKWGDVLDLEECKDDFFARKRVCIKTKQEDNILESFKIIVKGKVYVVRAKELFTWSPKFTDVDEMKFNSSSDDESVKELGVKAVLEEESDDEVVSNTFYGDYSDKDGKPNEPVNKSEEKETSIDPFNIYDLLNKNKKGVEGTVSDASIPFPPGFTPVNELPIKDDSHLKTGSDPEALGFSGGILCAWDFNVFRKEQYTISDNFVALFNLVTRWNGESILMGDFNEVRRMVERWGSNFNSSGARVFNNIIDNTGLLDLQLEGFSFTWAHPSAKKMSKLDSFLVTDGLLSSFPHISAVCLDRHLSDHRPILLREVFADYGATPFRLYHSWFSYQGFDQMVTCLWNSISLSDSNDMIRFKKKLQILKKEIRGGVNDDILLARTEYMNLMLETKAVETRDYIQKAKVQWAVEGDENSKFFMELSIESLLISLLKAAELENPISREEIRNAVWSCGENKSPGPDGFTFEFFRKFWHVVGSDFSLAVEWFFRHASFSIGCNSSFIALISKNLYPKSVSDFRPISLIGCIYKVILKIIQTRLSLVIDGLISDVQSAFLPNRQILDGPFIINELLARCRYKKKNALVFKVDFAKAYDSIRCLMSSMASILVNGSPTSEFQFYRGLKQGDPLAPYLFILVMESLHLSFSLLIDAGFFTGVRLDASTTISHLFYVDDAKSQLLGVGIPSFKVNEAAAMLGCSVMKAPFKYLGVLVGGNSSLINTWEYSTNKIKLRLSKWKIKTFSIGGRLTLLKSVLGATPIYQMYLYKAPKAVLNQMEALRRKFFHGAQDDDRKIVWVKWAKVLASKKHGGLGVSSFYALNRVLLLKGGVEASQLASLLGILGSVLLSNSGNRWIWDMNGDGQFRVKDFRGNSSSINTWEDSTNKIKLQLSKWKIKTLSIGGRLTLLKSVLGATPIYQISLYKAPKAVLMEALRRNFFHEAQDDDRKIAWVKWAKVLASKKHGGLGVSSFYALNRALLLKWVWRYLSRDGSLWYRVINAIHGSNTQTLPVAFSSNWSSIVKEVSVLKNKGMDFLSHCKIKIGNGRDTSFWKDLWIGDSLLCDTFPRLYALEIHKECKVDAKLKFPFTAL